MSDPPKPAAGKPADRRRERLGAALRENLKRRKDQSRARREAGAGDPPEQPPGRDGD